MLAWQRLDGGNAGHELGKPSESAKCWIEAFAHYQQQGVIKKDVNLYHLVLMISTLCSSLVFDMKASPENTEAYLASCIDVIQNYCN